MPPKNFAHSQCRRVSACCPEENDPAPGCRVCGEPLGASARLCVHCGAAHEALDEAANAEFSEYIAGRIRQRVKDQKVADKLIPRNHGFGTRRVPLETKYYEVYNQPNVSLVDIKETPIERITEKGLRVGGRDYEFDVIIYATGFDAITGSFDRIDIRGTGGQRLKDIPLANAIVALKAETGAVVWSFQTVHHDVWDYDLPAQPTPEAGALILTILRSPRNVATALRQMHETGVLGRFVPEFGKVVSMMQFNMYHHYTVDEHLIKTVGELKAIEDGKLADPLPLSTELRPLRQSSRTAFSPRAVLETKTR